MLIIRTRWASLLKSAHCDVSSLNRCSFEYWQCFDAHLSFVARSCGHEIRSKFQSSLIHLSGSGMRRHHTQCYNILTPISQVIEKDTKVRLKVVGTRVDQTEIVRYLLLLIDPTNLIFTPVCHCNNKRRPLGRYRLDTLGPAYPPARESPSWVR